MKRRIKRPSWLLAIPALLCILAALAFPRSGAAPQKEASPAETVPAAADPASGEIPTLPDPPPAPAAEEESVPLPDGEADPETPAGPLAIWEIRSADGDAVELKNISDAPVLLSDYYLSDKKEEPQKLRLPEQTLEPGGLYVSRELSLSVKGEKLWLRDGDGALLDTIRYGQLPVGGSMGRMEGEPGWFFFAESSLGEENRDGFRRVAESPIPSTPAGAYDGVELLTVALSGEGEIRYTLDGSAPNADSPLYTEPLTLRGTTVLRAICLEADALPSRILTCGYFLNEGHSLPIVSFCSDDVQAWMGFYRGRSRFGEFAGAAAMYENGREVFIQACGLRLKGFSAVLDPLKKNIGFYFRGRYGDGALEDVDLFGEGAADYSSLLVRAGQDHYSTLIRNELMQELCLQASEHVPCQHHRYCVLYMNGDYRGIYNLTENMNEHFFADWYGVSAESVVTRRQIPDVRGDEELMAAIRFCAEGDMADPAQYARFCQLFDIDNVIDYLLLEGFSGNTDLYQNVRYFRSDELDGKWRFAFFDLDCCFYSYECGMRVVFNGYGKKNYEVDGMVQSLIRSPAFRDRLLRRYAQWIEGPLSPENMLRVIDRLEAEILPELDRDRERAGIGLAYWEYRMEELRGFASEEYIRATLDVLCEDLDLSPEERALYFGER
jgi:hypothetical protein